jgi:hypothetical protein
MPSPAFYLRGLRQKGKREESEEGEGGGFGGGICRGESMIRGGAAFGTPGGSGPEIVAAVGAEVETFTGAAAEMLDCEDCEWEKGEKKEEVVVDGEVEVVSPGPAAGGVVIVPSDAEIARNRGGSIPEVGIG